MPHAKIAIIGRPNVGKSTLFNILTRSRQAVVKNQPGVTRDVIQGTTEWWGKTFEVLDTGGLTESKEAFLPLVRKKVLSILDDMDLLLIVVDGKAGLTYEDKDVVRIVQQSRIPYLIVVNKVDQMHKADILISEFYELKGEIIAASFEQRAGVDEVVTWILDRITDAEIEKPSGVRLAIVGKPNVGKSSLFNKLVGSERMLVSEVAGTTVDAVEDSFVYNKQNYRLVDTSGLRRLAKRKKAGDGVEILASFKAHKTIDHADIILLLVDAVEGPTDQDTKLVQYIFDQHKALILVANKLDQAEQTRPAARKWFLQRVEKEFHFFPDIPVVFISAHKGTGIMALFAKVESIWKKLNIRIPTSKLNAFFYDVTRQAPAPVYGTKNVKFYYLTQTRQHPPSFIAFANQPLGVTPTYRRFLTNRIQENWGLEGIPIRMFIMKSASRSL